jgi:hypothetical protein
MLKQQQKKETKETKIAIGVSQQRKKKKPRRDKPPKLYAVEWKKAQKTCVLTG